MLVRVVVKANRQLTRFRRAHAPSRSRARPTASPTRMREDRGALGGEWAGSEDKRGRQQVLNRCQDAGKKSRSVYVRWLSVTVEKKNRLMHRKEVKMR